MTARKKKVQNKVEYLNRTELTDDYCIATYFQFEEGVVETTEQIHDNCLICRDVNDNILGIEIIDLSKCKDKQIFYLRNKIQQ